MVSMTMSWRDGGWMLNVKTWLFSVQVLPVLTSCWAQSSVVLVDCHADWPNLLTRASSSFWSCAGREERGVAIVVVAVLSVVVSTVVAAVDPLVPEVCASDKVTPLPSM